MAVYMITDISVKDAATYAQYVERVRAIVKKYGGQYLARGGKVTSLVGGWLPERITLIRFDSLAQIEDCFSSEEYQAIAPLRSHGPAEVSFFKSARHYFFLRHTKGTKPEPSSSSEAGTGTGMKPMLSNPVFGEPEVG